MQSTLYEQNEKTLRETCIMTVLSFLPRKTRKRVKSTAYGKTETLPKKKKKCIQNILYGRGSQPGVQVLSVVHLHFTGNKLGLRG